MLMVFKRTSNQTALEAVKRRIHASLFEIRLWNDDLRAIFRAQFDILRHNLTYLRLSLVPMFWMFVPFVLVVAQLQFHYGYDTLEPGDHALVKVQLREGTAGVRPDLVLDAPAGIRVETPGVWIADEREMAWRIAVEEQGDYQLTIRLDGQSFPKSLKVGGGVELLSPIRHGRGLVDQILYPAEGPLPGDTAIEAIHVGYRDRSVSLLGFELHWLLWFLILSIAFAFALRGRMGVTF